VVFNATSLEHPAELVTRSADVPTRAAILSECWWLRRVTGIITQLDRGHQRGTIRADDGTLHPFERESMVRWLEYPALKAGDRVTFELDGNDAINVERVAQPR
jgi:hypothetical protein